MTMKQFDFVVEFSNELSTERTVVAENEKQAHSAVWAGLTEAERDYTASIELVEVRDISEGNRLPVGTKVRYDYPCGTLYGQPARRSGTGVIVSADVLVGTDDAYAVRQDIDNQVAYIRDCNVKAVTK